MVSIFALFIECLIMAFLQANGMDGRPVAWMLVAIGLFSLAYLYDIGKSRRLRYVSVPLILGYIMRLALLVFDRYGQQIYSLPNSGADSEMFYVNATHYAFFGYAPRESMFIQVLGEIFSWIGDSRIYVQFLLMLCSIVALHTAEKIMEELAVEIHQRVKAMYILCLLPNFAIISSIFLRESIVTMLIAISLLCFVKWMKGKPEKWFVLAFIFAFLAARFHSGTVAVAVGYIVVRLLYNRHKQVFALTWKNIIVALLFVFIFLFLYNNYGSRFFGKVQGVDSVEDIASGRGAGGSSYAAYVGDSSTVKNMIMYTPARVVYFLFSPFPWQWRGVSDIIAFCLSSTFYLWSVIRTIKYLLAGYHKNREIVIAFFIIALCTLFVFGWGVSNTGTAVRHRDKMVILYGVLLSLTKRPPQYNLSRNES